MTTAPSSSPWIDWGGEGPVLHLGHANGFPPESYAKLIDALKGSFHVVSLPARPLWPGPNDPATLDSWMTLADDLVVELERRGLSGIYGWGHSLGGVVTLLAAAKKPQLFRAIVAVDPVLFTGAFAATWGLLQRLGLAHTTPIVKSALRRRELYDSAEQVRSRLQTKPLFARTDPDCLDDYIRGAFRPLVSGKLTLRYTKAWEARIFATTPHSVWKSLRQLEIPVLFLRGQDSDTFSARALARVNREVRQSTCVELVGTTHLLPLEQPLAVAVHTRDFLTSAVASGRPDLRSHRR